MTELHQDELIKSKLTPLTYLDVQVDPLAPLGLQGLLQHGERHNGSPPGQPSVSNTIPLHCFCYCCFTSNYSQVLLRTLSFRLLYYWLKAKRQPVVQGVLHSPLGPTGPSGHTVY